MAETVIENVTSAQSWVALRADPSAHLVDVRTHAEWAFVGLPDLSGAGKQAVPIEWQTYPSMAVNPAFIDALRQHGLTSSNTIYFLCRSGARSLAAAQLARRHGFDRVFNVADGFEGPADDQGHRGVVMGWKAEGLPWRQR